MKIENKEFTDLNIHELYSILKLSEVFIIEQDKLLRL